MPDALFLRTYHSLDQIIYGQEIDNISLYGSHILENKKISVQQYKISYELLTVYQAAALAFQTMLNIESQKKEDIAPLSQILLGEALKFQPEKSYSVDSNICYDFEERISYPDLLSVQGKLWQMILKNIAHTPLASIWSLFIPFLEKAFLKGLCPFSFYYHVTLSPHPQKIIHAAQSLLEYEGCFQKAVPIPRTYRLLRYKPFKTENIDISQTDSLTEIIKSYCEKE